MYQYDDPTAASALPAPAAPGAPGYFTDGSPTNGVPATELRSDFMNMLMMELLNLVTAGGLTPSKTTYTQVRDAILKLCGSGRLLNMQYLTGSGTYIETPGTNSIIADLIGGGSAAGGSPATGAGQVSVGGGGGAGSFLRVRMLTGFSGVQYSVGAGGIGAAGAPGGSGGTTTFGNFSASGGAGGGAAGPTASTANFYANRGVGASLPTGGDINVRGTAGEIGIMLGGAGAGGSGAGTIYGGGGLGVGGAAGQPGSGFGGGGGGGSIGPNAAALTGGAGAPGGIIVFEYS